MRFVASLAVRSVRARRGSGLAAGLGIAAAAAVLIVVLVGATVARDRSITQTIERLPEPSRSVRAVWFGVPHGDQESWAALDRSARGALAETSLPTPTSIVLVRESTIAGRFVGLAAVDGLRPYVELHSGRMPTRCRPEHCEVLRLRGVGRLPDVPGLRIVEVGRASLRSRVLFGDFLEASDNALGAARLAPALRTAGRYHSPPPGPLVVAEGVAGLAASPELGRSYRSYAWVAPLGSGTPRAWGVTEMLRDVARARARLAAESTSWSLADPRQELLEADRSVTVSSRRLVLVGGEGVALLVAFALLAAGGIRHELERARRRLTWSGATRAQKAFIGLVESALVGFGGTLLGFVIGTLVGAVAAAAAGAPVGAVLGASVLSPLGLGLTLGLAVAATLVVWAAASLPRVGNARFGAGEAVAGVALLVVAVALLGGQVDASRLAEDGGAAVLLLALPGLVALVAAVAASRLVPAAARPLARRSGGRPALRIAATSVARRAGLAGVAVAFLTLAVGLALFAETYRSTLSRSERDVAAFTVPTAFLVHENLSTLVPVLDAAPLSRFQALARPGAAYPATRISASAGRSNAISGVTVLALPREVVPALSIWRPQWGVTRHELERLVGEGTGTELSGVRVGDRVRLRVGPTPLGFRLAIRATDGTAATLKAPPADTRRATVLDVPVPRALRGGLLVGIELVTPRIIERGADAGEALSGMLDLTADGLRLDHWIGTGGASATASSGTGLRVAYTLTPQRLGRLRPRQPTDTAPPRVAVSPALAELAGGVGGTLPLRIDGELVDVRVGAIIDRFPSVSGELVVGNLDALTTAIATVAPGSTRTSELWLDVPAAERGRVATELGRSPFGTLSVGSQDAVERDARRDPLGHGTLLALGASSLVALILAVIGLALAVRGDLRDERGELVDLEALGASPALLRRSVRLRALLVFVGGLVGGVAAGAVLAGLTARVVRVTARAGDAEPPLATVVDPTVLVLGLLVLIAASAVAVVLVSRAAFSDPRGPGRVGGSG